MHTHNFFFYSTQLHSTLQIGVKTFKLLFFFFFFFLFFFFYISIMHFIHNSTIFRLSSQNVFLFGILFSLCRWKKKYKPNFLSGSYLVVNNKLYVFFSVGCVTFSSFNIQAQKLWCFVGNLHANQKKKKIPKGSEN